MEILKDQSLKQLNSWKVGGLAEYYCQPTSLEEVREAITFAKKNNLKINVLSGGSNILVSDRQISGLTLHLSELSGVEVVEGERIQLLCWAGTPKSDLAKVFLQKKLAPAVFLTGLPGDMGGGVVMNAGIGENRTPREFCEIVDWIEVIDLDGSIRRIEGKDLHWEYRNSSGWQPGVITRVQVSWKNEPDNEVMNQVREANKKRVATQPLNQPSCGSVFRNPPGLKSAKLIDECGLKGLQVGGAQVSMKHANFIVNVGNASAKDILQLIETVKSKVKQQTGVELHREVVLFGDWN